MPADLEAGTQGRLASRLPPGGGGQPGRPDLRGRRRGLRDGRGRGAGRPRGRRGDRGLRPAGPRASARRSATPSSGPCEHDARQAEERGEAARAGGGHVPRRRHRRPAGPAATVRIPLFEFPNGAARVLGPHGRPRRLAGPTRGHAARRTTRPRSTPARALVAELLGAHPDGAWLDVDRRRPRCSSSCGLPLMPFRLVRSADEAVAAADDARRPGGGQGHRARAAEQERGGRRGARRPRTRRGAGRLRAHGRPCSATP